MKGGIANINVSISQYNQNKVSSENILNNDIVEIKIDSPRSDIISTEVSPLLKRDELNKSLTKLRENNCLFDKVKCNKVKLVQLALSGIVGIGTGLAMLPIFDAEINDLEDAGLNIDKYNITSIAVSVNTLLLFSSVATISLYHYMKEKNNDANITELKKVALEVSKVAAMCATILPVSQLWATEISNQEITGSEGFNEFIAWATITTVPLCIFKSIEAYDYLKDFILNKLDSIPLDTVGSKLFVYMPTVLSATGRFIAYSASASYLGTEIGLSSEFSVAMGILIGGIAGSTVIGIGEYNSLKYLFSEREHPLSWKQKVGAALCMGEGVLLTLPLVTTGMEAVKEWSPYIKGILFAPLFLSHAIYEGRSIYKAFEYLFHVPYEDEPKVRLELVGVSNIDSPSDNTGDIDLLGLNDNIENI